MRRRRSVALFALASLAALPPAQAHGIGAAGLYLAIPVIVLGAVAFALVVKTLFRPWGGPASGPWRPGLLAAAALLVLSGAGVLVSGAASFGDPPRLGPVMWRALTVATLLGALLIGVRRLTRGPGPRAWLPRLQQSMAAAWLVLLFPPIFGWDLGARHQAPLHQSPQDTPLPVLRALLPGEVGERLTQAQPGAGTCVLRVLLPGVPASNTLAIASYGTGVPTYFAEGAVAHWVRDGAAVVGLAGPDRTGVAVVDRPIGRSGSTWQLDFGPLWPPERWQADRERSALLASRHAQRMALAESVQAARGDPARQAEADALEARLRIPDPSVPEPPQVLEPHRLNVRTDRELPCAAPADGCRRFRGHLVADGATVWVEERCGGPQAAATHSLFRRR